MVLAILVAMSTMLAAQSQGTEQNSEKGADGPDNTRAERGHRGPPSPEQRVLRMSEMMDLSSDQVTGLLEVFKAAQQEAESLRGLARQEMLPELCALHLVTEEQVATILTRDQLAQMEQMKTKREARKHQQTDRKNRMMACEELEGSHA